MSSLEHADNHDRRFVSFGYFELPALNKPLVGSDYERRLAGKLPPNSRELEAHDERDRGRQKQPIELLLELVAREIPLTGSDLLCMAECLAYEGEIEGAKRLQTSGVQRALRRLEDPRFAKQLIESGEMRSELIQRVRDALGDVLARVDFGRSCEELAMRECATPRELKRLLLEAEHASSKQLDFLVKTWLKQEKFSVGDIELLFELARDRGAVQVQSHRGDGPLMARVDAANPELLRKLNTQFTAGPAIDFYSLTKLSPEYEELGRKWVSDLRGVGPSPRVGEMIAAAGRKLGIEGLTLAIYRDEWLLYHNGRIAISESRSDEFAPDRKLLGAEVEGMIRRR